MLLSGLGRSPDELEAEGYVDVCATSDVPGLVPLHVVVDGQGVLICRHMMRFFAVDEICPHRQQSMSDGTIEAGTVVCPHHQYAFELETGRCTTRASCGPLTRYELEISEGRVFIRVPDGTTSEDAGDEAATEP